MRCSIHMWVWRLGGTEGKEEGLRFPWTLSFRLEERDYSCDIILALAKIAGENCWMDLLRPKSNELYLEQD